MNNPSFRIGITGSDGFIGTHVTKLLNETEQTVIPFVGNLLDPVAVTEYFQTNRITHMIHLLGTSRPPFTHQLEKNVTMTQQLLEIGIPYGLKTMLYSSTGIVYGESENGELFSETDTPHPTSDYGLTKLFAEECIQRYHRTDDLHYVILRFSNVYGPGHYRGVLYDLLTSIKESGNVTITGDGNQRRNFIHVDDVCQALLKALSYSESDTFNIGNVQANTLNDLVLLLKERYEFTVQNAPVDTTKPRASGMNVEKAKKVLGFEAQKTMEAFLDELG